MKMATWAEINGKVGTNGSPLTKCPTMREVLNADSRIHIKGSYSANKLVALDDVVALMENIIHIQIYSSNRIYWRSTYPLASNISATMDYINVYGDLSRYSFVMSVGQISKTIDLSFSIREYAGITINTSCDDSYYYSIDDGMV